MPVIDPASAGGLFTKATLRESLGGISERKFEQLQAAGIVPPPLELGPRCPRWTHEDRAEILRRLPRRERQAEPAQLAATRQVGK